MTWNVFYSYSHEDAHLRNRLSTYLDPLERNKTIVGWYDRKIEPGAKWEIEINNQIDTAHLILFLISENFLASDYCFGVEVERAMARQKSGDVKVIPILLKPCLWEESRFRELQIIPRDNRPITLWPSQEEAFVELAKEIRRIVSAEPPVSHTLAQSQTSESFIVASLDIVREQIRSYANLYEKIRQRMAYSNERTMRMEQVFQNMRALATASYPLIEEFANSPLPGERLAAVAILQVFASPHYFSYLVELIGKEKAFVGYHAAKALQFAVSALDPRNHHVLLQTLIDAQEVLATAIPGADSERQIIIKAAKIEILAIINSLTAKEAD